MFQDILLGLPLGIIMAFMFGPVFFVLLETAAMRGTRAAIIFDVGVLLADAVFLLIAYFSTSKLLESVKDEPWLFIFGGCLLIVYGIITMIKQRRNLFLMRPNHSRKTKKGDWFGLFIKGFLLNFVNIGVLGFWLGIIVAFGPTMEMNPYRLFVFFTTILATYFVVDLAKIFLAKKLEDRLTPRLVFQMKRTISLIIFLCGIVLLMRGVFPKPMKKVQNQIEHAVPMGEKVKKIQDSTRK